MRERIGKLLAYFSVIHSMKINLFRSKMLFWGIALLLSFCFLQVYAQQGVQKDSTSYNKINVQPSLPPLSSMLQEPLMLPDSVNRMYIPAYKQGFFCRFEDVMQMKWKLPLNLELK